MPTDVEHLRAELARRKSSNDLLTLIEFVIECGEGGAVIPQHVIDAAVRLLDQSIAPSPA